MRRGIMLLAAALGGGAILLPSLPVYAAGPYDGTWVVDIPSVITGEGVPSCPATRIQFKIADNAVSGSLQQVAGGRVETGSSNRTAAPVSGNVDSAGMLKMEWQGFKASGKLQGNSAKLSVQRTCGHVDATATRVPS